MRNTNPFMDILFIIIGLFFIGYNLYKDKITSASDLVEINGTVQRYSFDENTSIRSTTYSYFIYLKEYSPGFQVSADFVNYFDKNKFVQSIKNGDSLKIFISKSDLTKIGSIEKVMAFGIDSKRNEFLNLENVITEYNKKTVIVFGLLFIVAGMILLYLDLKRIKRRNLEREKTTANTFGKN